VIARAPARRTVAIVTGTRAEYGLLLPVMLAVQKHKKLELRVIAAGAHFLPPARTIREVESAFAIAARVPMQSGMPVLRAGSSRLADAAALGRGISGFARAFATLEPDWIVVLGDRTEAFAAASAASIAGIAVCHIHGGDRAEGIADEAMRHAITKLSHLHCAATKLSAGRIIRMGEKLEHVHVTGSPAIDGLSRTKPMSNAEAAKYGDPKVVVLLHPAGLRDEDELEWARHAFGIAGVLGGTQSELEVKQGRRVLLLMPNSDPGRDSIVRVWRRTTGTGGKIIDHLPRPMFVALLKRLAVHSGVLIGNSSAGLIEACALGVRVMNLGPRQAGREHGHNVVHVARPDKPSILQAMRRVQELRPCPDHRFGDGRASPRIASLLARIDPHASAILRKHNTY